ncbi:MAG TPA: ABC transporter permease [Thermomicrobiales bacterium]|nr:ABC transporter permease [Thermomicrobiales bacterium]
MGRYIVGRLLGLAFVLFVVSLIAFLLMHAVPGGPFAPDEKGRLPEATRQAQLEKYGLDQPIYVQYVKYMWNALQLDFGVPFQSPTETVTELIARAWPVTIRIGIPTIILAYGLGTLLGFIAAIRQNSWVDYFVSFISTLGLVVPNFVVALWLILFFSVYLGWLEPGGWGKPQHYIMPVIAYSLTPMALVARYTRSSILEVMRSDHVRTARAKGLAERKVLLWHVGRNAMIPFVTILLPEIPNILTGSIFIEAAFRIPGLGRFFVTSTQSRDYPMILALVLLIAVLWGITYIITDVLYTILDPRIRLGGRSAV